MKPITFWQIAFFLLAWAAYDIGWAFLYFMGAGLVSTILDAASV